MTDNSSDKIKNFINGLTGEQLQRLDRALDQLDYDQQYEKIAHDLGVSVDQVKAAELINGLVLEGFYNGVEDLTSGDFSDILNYPNK